MSGHAATALVLKSDRGQFRTLAIRSLGNPFRRIKGNLRFPLTFTFMDVPGFQRRRVSSGSNSPNILLKKGRSGPEAAEIARLLTSRPLQSVAL
jgi:hypothetical protein